MFSTDITSTHEGYRLLWQSIQNFSIASNVESGEGEVRRNSIVGDKRGSKEGDVENIFIGDSQVDINIHGRADCRKGIEKDIHDDKTDLADGVFGRITAETRNNVD